MAKSAVCQVNGRRNDQTVSGAPPTPVPALIFADRFAGGEPHIRTAEPVTPGVRSAASHAVRIPERLTGTTHGSLSRSASSTRPSGGIHHRNRESRLFTSRKTRRLLNPTCALTHEPQSQTHVIRRSTIRCKIASC
jgi:hypothetical protein